MIGEDAHLEADYEDRNGDPTGWWSDTDETYVGLGDFDAGVDDGDDGDDGDDPLSGDYHPSMIESEEMTP